MKVHVEALFTHDANLRIRSVNEPNGGNAPRFFLGRTAEGNIWRFHSDLPKPLVKELKHLCIDEPIVDDLERKPRHFESYLALIQKHAPVQKVWTGPAYCFPEGLRVTAVCIV